MDRSQRRTRWRRLAAGVPRALRALLSARAGAIGIAVVVAIPVLGGFAGLAIVATMASTSKCLTSTGAAMTRVSFPLLITVYITYRMVACQ